MITLKNNSEDDKSLEASFLPEKGMNLISYKKDGKEIIEQSTKDLFEERFSGLGPIIGPHFHRRIPQSLPFIEKEELFPHIRRVKEKGILDPFSHGIARYAPWNYEANETSIKASLSGKDLWNGIALMDLEGQNFKMQFHATLLPNGLSLNLSVVSDTNSLVGLHYFYSLPQSGKIISQVKNFYLDNGEKKDIPKEWLNDKSQLSFDLSQAADYTFFPSPNPLGSTIILETEHYKLRTQYSSHCQENSWQLYHPKDASFVCIEPLSAQFPRHPILTVSSISALLSIE